MYSVFSGNLRKWRVLKLKQKNHNLEQRVVIKFCVYLRKSSTETKQMIDTAGDGVHVSRSMVF